MYAGQAGAGGIRRTRRMKVISPRLATVADVGSRAFEWPWGSRRASGPMHAVTARRQATRHRQIRCAMLRLSAHGAPGGREGEGSVAAKDKRKRRVKTSCFVWNRLVSTGAKRFFLGVRPVNAFPTRYIPLKSRSPTPLHYPLIVEKPSSLSSRDGGSTSWVLFHPWLYQLGSGGDNDAGFIILFAEKLN